MGPVLVQSNASLDVWQRDQWNEAAAGQGLVDEFNRLGYGDKVQSIMEACDAPRDQRLEQLKAATGNLVQTSDINYVWTSDGRMALMLDSNRGQPEQMPPVGRKAAEAVTYDG